MNHINDEEIQVQVTISKSQLVTMVMFNLMTKNKVN